MSFNRTISLIFIVLFFSAPLFASEEAWQLKKNEDGIKVYTRAVENFPTLEFKGTMTVDVQRNKVVSFYENEALYPEWFYQCASAQVLETRSETEKLIYYVMRMPWPVSDRDSVYKRVKSVEPGGDIVFRLSAEPESYARQKGKVRVSYLKIEWRFKALSDGKTDVSFQQHSSADGYIPATIVNKLSVNMPLRTFQKMRFFLTKKAGALQKI